MLLKTGVMEGCRIDCRWNCRHRHRYRVGGGGVLMGLIGYPNNEGHAEEEKHLGGGCEIPSEAFPEKNNTKARQPATHLNKP